MRMRKLTLNRIHLITLTDDAYDWLRQHDEISHYVETLILEDKAKHDKFNSELIQTS